jgi:hypothetical protein
MGFFFGGLFFYCAIKDLYGFLLFFFGSGILMPEEANSNIKI